MYLKSTGKPLKEFKQVDDIVKITFSQPSVWKQRGDWVRGCQRGFGETSWNVRNELPLLSGYGSLDQDGASGDE